MLNFAGLIIYVETNFLFYNKIIKYMRLVLAEFNMEHRIMSFSPKPLAILIAAFFIASTNVAFSDDSGLIIPMPGQKQLKKEKNLQKHKTTNNQEDTNNKNTRETLIPLPPKIDHSKTNNSKPIAEPKKEKDEPVKEDVPLIRIVPLDEPEKKTEINNANFPTIPDEVVVSPEPLTPREELPAGSSDLVESGPEPAEYPIYPKDTSSAVFMVMKTWQCTDYDGNTLLRHAVQVYSQEADEQFQIKGLTDETNFKIDLDEEDITLDELLDLIALKTGRDWGVDIPSKTIYFYPKGIKTDSAASW
ncbi:MAG: hypothetical protein Kow0029_30330 [Candidatus Rifleibacteriota bacterium]